MKFIINNISGQNIRAEKIINNYLWKGVDSPVAFGCEFEWVVTTLSRGGDCGDEKYACHVQEGCGKRLQIKTLSRHQVGRPRPMDKNRAENSVKIGERKGRGENALDASGRLMRGKGDGERKLTPGIKLQISIRNSSDYFHSGCVQVRPYILIRSFFKSSFPIRCFPPKRTPFRFLSLLLNFNRTLSSSSSTPRKKKKNIRKTYDF